MAVNEATERVSLSLQSNLGTDSAGDKIQAKKTFSGINRAASAEQIMTGAKAIHTLYAGTLEKVTTATYKALTEEA